MNIPENLESVLSRDERATFALRKLYADCGYSRYKMSKFEEYDLYVRNKDFLVSDGIITFTDTDGRLMALKPDVTLSIIKNSRVPSGVTKLFYNENVYRVSAGTNAFREIMQVGLECIGEIGAEEIGEVLKLAKESLATLSNSYVLAVSSLDLVLALLSHFGIGETDAALIIKNLSEKNAEAIRAVALSLGLSDSDADKLALLADIYGDTASALGSLEELKLSGECEAAIDALALATSSLGERAVIDFSVTGNASYYNGLAFVGYIEGVPTGILKGGQYDKLAERVSGRKTRAIGFAVYLDELEKLGAEV